MTFYRGGARRRRDAIEHAIIEALRARGVPFLLATGYGATDGSAESYPDAVILKKPYTKRSVQTSFTLLLRGEDQG